MCKLNFKISYLFIILALISCTPNNQKDNVQNKLPIRIEKGEKYFLNVQAPLSPLKFSSSLEIVSDSFYDGFYIRAEGKAGVNKVQIFGNSKTGSLSLSIYLDPKVILNKYYYGKSDFVECQFENQNIDEKLIGKSTIFEGFDFPKGICSLTKLDSAKITENSNSIIEIRQEFSDERLLGLLELSKAPVQPGDIWKITALPFSQSSPMTFTVKITSQYKKQFNDSLDTVIAELSYQNGVGYVDSSAWRGGEKATFEGGYTTFTFFQNPNVKRTVELLGKNGKEKYTSCSVDFLDNPTTVLDGRVYETTGEEKDASFDNGNYLSYGECSAQKIK